MAACFFDFGQLFGMVKMARASILTGPVAVSIPADSISSSARAASLSSYAFVFAGV